MLLQTVPLWCVSGFLPAETRQWSRSAQTHQVTAHPHTLPTTVPLYAHIQGYCSQHASNAIRFARFGLWNHSCSMWRLGLLLALAAAHPCPMNCNGHGACDLGASDHQARGRCACFEGWTGFSCEQREWTGSCTARGRGRTRNELELATQPRPLERPRRLSKRCPVVRLCQEHRWSA